ncbi:MAG: NAD(P)-dependent oxidoreductase [archaeon]|nr:NAD(P)-dependent oxidoreductase [archaeon]
MSKESILITGGAGFLGNIITRHFLGNGHKVGCLDNLMYRQDYSIMPLASDPNFEFIFGDVRDEALLKKQVPKFDVIFPLAAIVGGPACEHRPFDAQTINQDAVVLIEKIMGAGQKIVFPNTNSGYGTKSGTFHCNEMTPLEPISLYGKTKCAAEDAVRGSNKGSVVYRLASVFGVSPRMRAELSFHDMVLQAMTTGAIVMSEGSFTRNYVYIKDVASAFEYASNNYDSMKGEAFNLGCDDANITRRGLAQKVATHIPGTIIYENESKADPDKRNYLVSNEKLRKAGFEAKTSIDYGIQEVIRGFSIMLKNNPNKNV